MDKTNIFEREEKQDKILPIKLYPSVYDIVVERAAQVGLKPSQYIKRLVMADLKDAGLLK